MAWCYDIAPSCCGKKLVQFGTSFGTNFLQTGASLKKAHGSERDLVTYVCETTYAVSSRLDLFYRGNMQLYIVASSKKYEINHGSFCLFIHYLSFLGILERTFVCAKVMCVLATYVIRCSIYLWNQVLISYKYICCCSVCNDIARGTYWGTCW